MISLVFIDILVVLVLNRFHHLDKNSQDLWYKNIHKNQADHDKDLKNSLKSSWYMAVKCQEVLGSLCHDRFGFYGYFSVQDLGYFCLNDGI